MVVKFTRPLIIGKLLAISNLFCIFVRSKGSYPNDKKKVKMEVLDFYDGFNWKKFYLASFCMPSGQCFTFLQNVADHTETYTLLTTYTVEYKRRLNMAPVRIDGATYEIDLD